MEYSKFTCPICGEDMVERKGKGTGYSFYGCPNYPHCNGKRTLDGEVFGCESYDDTPIGLSQESESWFNVARREGYSREDAEQIAQDWERHKDD